MPFSDHPYFVGLQAHPEFCTRPLNPSPPFLGFVAAASGSAEFAAQLDIQLATFKPPHPEESMVGEAVLRLGIPVGHGAEQILLNGNREPAAVNGL